MAESGAAARFGRVSPTEPDGLDGDLRQNRAARPGSDAPALDQEADASYQGADRDHRRAGC
ncbi:MAG: hypothetical protein ACTIH8_00285, partial [Microbacterium gubbeenense]